MVEEQHVISYRNKSKHEISGGKADSSDSVENSRHESDTALRTHRPILRADRSFPRSAVRIVYQQLTVVLLIGPIRAPPLENTSTYFHDRRAAAVIEHRSPVNPRARQRAPRRRTVVRGRSRPSNFHPDRDTPGPMKSPR